MTAKFVQGTNQGKAGIWVVQPAQSTAIFTEYPRLSDLSNFASDHKENRFIATFQLPTSYDEIAGFYPRVIYAAKLLDLS
ncbi:hypothetical protein BH10CYA1_BH10CYA1_08270 [soil metagenome]